MYINKIGKKQVLIYSLILLVMSLVVFGSGKLVVFGSGVEGSKETVRLIFGAPSGDSTYFAHRVALANALMIEKPQYQVTVIESSGGVEQIKMMYKGEVDLCSVSTNAAYQISRQEGDYKDMKFDKLRMMFLYAPSPMEAFVRVDSGITTYAELDGRPFCPGSTGSSQTINMEGVLEVLGVKPVLFYMATGDAGDAVKDNRVVGSVKGGEPPDPFVMEIAAARPLKLLSIPEEKLDEILEKMGWLAPYTIKAGSYDWLDEDALTVGHIVGIGTTSDLSDEIVYDILKVMWESDSRPLWEEALPAYNGADLIELTLTAGKTGVPLHAGAVKYFKELGYDIPESLIPPEYSENN